MKTSNININKTIMIISSLPFTIMDYGLVLVFNISLTVRGGREGKGWGKMVFYFFQQLN